MIFTFTRKAMGYFGQKLGIKLRKFHVPKRPVNDGLSFPPSLSLPLEVGPLNTARESGGAL